MKYALLTHTPLPYVGLLAVPCFTQCMIFCRTNLDCDNLEGYLRRLPGGSGGGGGAGEPVSARPEGGNDAESPWAGRFSCAVVGGARPVAERRAAVQAFKDGRVRLLISTDAGARGLDVQGLAYVVNMALPERPGDYVHRAGRAGRAGLAGLAVSLVGAERERVWRHQCRGAGGAAGCADVRDAADGGCCVWVSEPELLLAVEKQAVGRALEPLGHGLRLPPAGPAGAYGGPSARALGGAAGSAAAGQRSEAAAAHAEELRPAIERLEQLETELQRAFLMARARFSEIAADAGGRAPPLADIPPAKRQRELPA